jgi:predicted amidohydrolase
MLAAAQTVPVAGDVPANIDQHVVLAQQAADQGAALVLFPELSLTGYELERAAELAFTLDDARLDPLRELARDRAVQLVVGAPLRLDGRLHIAALVVGPDGVQAYTKRHLGAFPADLALRVPPPEPSVFVPGDLDPRILVGPHAAAVAICADVNRPAHAERAADAQIYLASMFVVPQDVRGDHATLQQRARTHAMTVVQANFGGPTGGLPAGGCSAAWGSDGRLLGQLPAVGAGVLLVSAGGHNERLHGVQPGQQI